MNKHINSEVGSDCLFFASKIVKLGQNEDHGIIAIVPNVEVQLFKFMHQITTDH